MASGRNASINDLWNYHNSQWRKPEEAVSHWAEAGNVDPRLLRQKTKGRFWEILAEHCITLIVSREYEHLLMGLSMFRGEPLTTYFAIPHPSGMAVDQQNRRLYAASTRNPNQIFTFKPVEEHLARLDGVDCEIEHNPLIPLRSDFYPGCLYIHDLALISGCLHANSVGQNAVIRFEEDGNYRLVWWPKCIEEETGPVFGQNHLQLNSIAAGRDIESSYFSASADKISQRRPGHVNFPVDKRGVIFSGATREPIARGLTRPHSARLYREKIWVDNSGYGELGFIESGKFVSVQKFPGWTRGLCIKDDIAFVGVSRVLPRFKQYAPGLSAEKTVCGVYAFDLKQGEIGGSVEWSFGNQVFATELMDGTVSGGFPMIAGGRKQNAKLRRFFYSFKRK